MEEVLNCSFCGRSEKELPGHMVTGRDGHICEECVLKAREVLQQEHAKEPQEVAAFDWRSFTPAQIKEHLDHYVVGQEHAKESLSVTVYNHYKRLAQTHLPQKSKEKGVELEKSNVVMVGPTGTGKTLLVRTLSKKLQVPFCIADATAFTEAGYVGEDVESVLSRLLQAANYNVELAQRGIVYIDEIDKLSRKSDNPSLSREVGGEGVQQALLKLMEGSIVNVPPEGGRKHPEQRLIAIDTTHILFICGGAFEGIEHTISGRLNTGKIGFGHNKKEPQAQEKNKGNLLRYLSAADLKAYGLIPELVGRIPVVVHLDPINYEGLHKILTYPKNALIKQYIQLLSMDDIELSFTEDALDYIVRQALALKLGARGLRTICEAIMQHAMYSLPSSEPKVSAFIVDRAYIEKELEKSLFVPPEEVAV